MVKWRLLPFIRLGAKKNNNQTNAAAADNAAAATNTTNSIEHHQSIYHHHHHHQEARRFVDESMFGCVDEITNCPNLHGLFELDDGETTCRWPSAELCLSTCKHCPLVEAAKQCTSLHGEIYDRMEFNEYIDWSTFFHNITTTTDDDDYPSYMKGARILNKGTPWVAEFPNYLSSEEVDEIIRVANIEGYRIEDEHPKHIRDVNVTNCDSINCMRQPIINELYARAYQLLNIHPNNYESMEFINYGINQHYTWHSDEYAWKDNPITQDPAAVIAGPRILTMFHYLSNVDDGGETAFAGPDPTGQTQRLKVIPSKGKMIIWANMKNNWRYSENSAVHSALPVKRGRKLAGTIWIHASGYRIPEMYSGQNCNPRYFYYYQQQKQKQQQKEKEKQQQQQQQQQKQQQQQQQQQQ